MSHSVQNEKPNLSSSSALWAALIFVGLILSAVNFVKAQGESDDHGHGAATEHHAEGAAHGHEDAHHGTAAPAHNNNNAAETHAAHPTDSTAAGEQAHH